MKEVWHKLWTSVRGDIRRNAIFREYIENEQMYSVHRCDDAMDRNKNCLLSELVDYNQDNVKPEKW